MQGHIPRAAYLDTNDLERGPLWKRVCDEGLLQLLLDHGIRHDTTVILYSRNTLPAARAAHLMLYAGVKDVRLLDGGLAGWQAADYPVVPGSPLPLSTAGDFGARFPACPDYMTDLHQARELVLTDAATLVSIRTWDEFNGRTSGYPYIAAKGEIPGARWGRAGSGSDVNSMSHFHCPDGTMKPPDVIQAFWREAGIQAGRRTVFYCGTSWRASLAFFYAWLMDWEQISVYDGGWYEWSCQAPQAGG